MFVDIFGWNNSRRFLINQLHAFAAELNNLSIIRYTLWIDGSFVTQKEQPKDLDVVVVLPAQAHRQFENALRALRDQFDGLDLYMVRFISQDEPDHFLYSSDQMEWFFQFTMTKPGRLTRQKFPKGFIQIDWNNESLFQSV
ncbi:DUF6932 family protein [Spirosoma spitsbergense]|uniref:DUF6932 family protein n=1 Tax=Spirosoma spitsbergense TaxID=431554 RepID=UPI003CCB856D